MNRCEEFNVKLERVRGLLKRTGLGGVMIRTRANFAWLTAGGLSYIYAASEIGVGSILVTADKAVLLANNIERRRFLEEELAGLPLESAEFAWYDGAGEAAAVAKITGGKPVGSDAGGEKNVGGDLAALRNPLLAPEIERYRKLGALTAATTESVCRRIRPGMSEFDVSAMIYADFEKQGVRVPVCLIAADERIMLRRHPIAIGHAIAKRVMVVVCCEQGGLIIALTRMVNLAPVDAELKKKHHAVCEVDATAIAATKPGRKFNEIFADIAAEYARQGYADEWKLHHQGGSTGYNGRDAFATPTSEAVVGVDQAFAWNPSITGTKCEDTILVTRTGFEMLSEPGRDWPVVEIERAGRKIRRADVLVLG